MSPSNASKPENFNQVFANLYGNLIAERSEAERSGFEALRNNFPPGIKLEFRNIRRKIFDKGFTPNWTEEIFVIEKVLNTNPKTYKLALTCKVNQ